MLLSFLGAPSDLATLFVIGGLLILPILARMARTGRAVHTLVLRRFEMRTAPPHPEAPLIEIVGRRQGITAFVLLLMQIDPQTTFEVTASDVSCRSGSLFGFVTTFIPLSRIASVTAGVSKPAGHLIAAAVILVVGFVGSIGSGYAIMFVICLIAALVLAVVYFLSKTILIQVSSNAGPEIMLQFRPNVIEGVPIDAARASEAIAIIRRLATARGSEPVLRRATVETVALADGPNGDRASEEWTSTPSAVAVNPVSSVPPPLPGNQEKTASDALNEAVGLYKARRKAEAIAKLTELVQRWPGTTAAATANGYLAQLTAAGQPLR